MPAFESLPQPESCRLIDFEEAELIPNVGPGSQGPILWVKGQGPCRNMEVNLWPRVYIDQPDYWGIEVVGCLPSGYCLTAVKDYEELLHQVPLGTAGVEVVGGTKSQRFDWPVPPE